MANLIPFLILAAAMGAAYGLGRLLTGWARQFGLRWGVLSQVTSRSSHTVPTPRLGGVGLALGFGLAATAFLFVQGLVTPERARLVFDTQVIVWAGLGWLLMFTVGLLDDLFDLPALLKLGLEVLAVLAPTVGGGLIFNAPVGLGLPWSVAFALGLGVAAFWLLFFTNGFNFMDGMDGFAAGFACTAVWLMFAALLLAGWRSGTLGSLRAEAWLLPLLALACWGFLHWNNPPARVFMGDGGSLSLGYLLALYVILGHRGALGATLPLVSAMTILLPFIFDVVLTLLRRARRGENLLKAHREHLYQRLMRTGLSHAEVLRLNQRRFMICGVLALAGLAFDVALGRWLGMVAALGVMVDYWRRTLERERRQEAGQA